MMLADSRQRRADWFVERYQLPSAALDYDGCESSCSHPAYASGILCFRNSAQHIDGTFSFSVRNRYNHCPLICDVNWIQAKKLASSADFGQYW